MLDYFYLASLAGSLVIILMVLSWLLAIKLNFFSLVDVAWSYAFAVVAGLYAYYGLGWSQRILLIFIMVSLWSIRLGTHLVQRLKSHFPTEDGRYITLRKSFEHKMNLKFLVFFLAQGLSVVLLSYPVLIATHNTHPKLHWLEYLGAGLWFLALIGEALSDKQLSDFKKNPENKGKVCQAGLWNYSRHPNYFFEWLIWVAYFVFACASPWGWISIFCPIVMLALLFKVTGIPATEAQSLKSKGNAYLDYQKTTSVFMPWFKKSSQ